MENEIKQVIVMRSDLPVSRGKIAAQCAHASIEAYRNARPSMKKAWLDSGQKKVVLAAKNLDDLMQINRAAAKFKINHALIRDAGLTEIPAGTATCLGIGPFKEREIDKITGSLPLLE